MKHAVLNLLGDRLAKDARKTLQSFATVTDVAPNKKAVLKEIAEATILLTGLDLRIDKEIIDAGKNLTIIATPTTGLDHIDQKVAEKRSIQIVSLRGEQGFLRLITGTAELSWALLLMVMRHLPEAIESVTQGQWDRAAFEGHSLSGKTLGVVGVGRLGKMIAGYGKAFSMDVIGYDPSAKDAPCKLVDWDTLLSESDVLSLHVPLNEETTYMFDSNAFKKMKKGAVLINTSRGAVVHDVDLLKALESGQLGGYAADVVTDELSFPETMAANALIQYAHTHDNVIITPHIGGMTEESRCATDAFIVEKLKGMV